MHGFGKTHDNRTPIERFIWLLERNRSIHCFNKISIDQSYIFETMANERNLNYLFKKYE